MAVTNNFSASALDLNGQVALTQPTALVWGPDGRLYVTENGGQVNVLTVKFGDPDTGDADPTLAFYVDAATTLALDVQNHNDDGTENASGARQVTGIEVTSQYDAVGERLYVQADGSVGTTVTGDPAVTMYVTSSDKRTGAGGSGADDNLDTNSGVITMFTQTGPDSWEQVDIVRGLPRSEENHATNGLQMIQEFAPDGVTLVSERLIVASGGNANTGAPSNNFAGQQEQPLSAAILEIDVTALKVLGVSNDGDRDYIYDLPTLDDPTRAGLNDNNDPNGGNDGLNSATLDYADPYVTIYSPGYRNAFDVLVTEDGRVWTYDNGANNSWGGRPIGETETGAGFTKDAEDPNYISTNLNNGEGNASDDINLEDWNPKNDDNFHEITRSDDLDPGESLSEGGFGAVTTYQGPDGLTYVYGGHPNPTRAEGAKAGLLFSPDAGTDNAYLLVSIFDSYNEDGDDNPLTNSDYDQVIAWLQEVELNNGDFPSTGIYGAGPGDLTKKVLAVTPGVEYNIYSFADGSGAAVEVGQPAPSGGTLQGQSGLPADIAEIVSFRNKIEGSYLEGGRADGALDSGKGSINGLAEYTSTIFDDGTIDMSGAIFASSLNLGSLVIMGRNADGTMSSSPTSAGAQASDRITFDAAGSPLGLASIGDDYADRGLNKAFQGSVWTAVYNTAGGVAIQVLQPGDVANNPLLGENLYAGQEPVNPDDRDFDGLSKFVDPFEFSDTNGYDLAAGQKLVLNFDAGTGDFQNSLGNLGLLGAALDGPNSLAGPLAAQPGDQSTVDIQQAGATANQDAFTGTYLDDAGDNIGIDQQTDGLYDLAGNIIPGGNAPILQIKEVVPGTMVGQANTARDALHTGIKPSADVGRIELTLTAKNWVAAAGGVASDQLTGLVFGDGTQANFLRFVFGEVNGAPGLEIGYEIGDAGYTTLATPALSGLSNANFDAIDLRLAINTKTFEVKAFYRLASNADLATTPFTEVPLAGGAGFTLPTGVLRDVLTGGHTITDGATTASSGASVGVVAETSDGNPLKAIDFTNLDIEAFGNEIEASTAAEVAAAGTAGLDTVLYDGSDTDLTLGLEAENFDGAGSAADFVLTANDLDNLIRVGSGTNTVTTGAGADSVRGTLADLDGDVITDFSVDDAVLIEGATLTNLGTPVFGGAAGSAIITLGGTTITLGGPDLDDYDPADGVASINITQVADGVRITLEPALSPVIAISAGGADLLGATVRDQSVDFLSDAAGGGAAQFLTGVVSKSYTNATIAGTNIPDTDLDPIHQTERSAVDTGKWGYAIPVEDGNYLVDLYFAEIFHGVAGGTNGPGSRLFDIFIENGTVETGLDVLTEAGGPAKELVKTYQATVTDGVLNIEFDATVDQAKLSGLVVWKVGGTFTPPPDSIAPEIVSIDVANPVSDQDSPREMTVVLSDNEGFDQAALEALTGSELSFSGIVPSNVSAPSVVLSDGGKTATLTYTLGTPADGAAWPASAFGDVTIADGAYADANGNTTAATGATFASTPNIANLTGKGAVALAINVGPTTNAIDATLAGDDKNTYGGAIADDPIIGVALQADDPSYYSPSSKTASNIDGKAGSTGSNPGLDGSALHTYRDSAAGSFTATYPVANGIYVVELWFAELFHATGGLRQGDYTINGVPAFENFDAFTAAGAADTAVSVPKTVVVTDGRIVIDVNADTGQPGYNAIVIYEAVDTDLPPTISVGDVTVAEGGTATLTFTRIGDTAEAVTVDFSVTPGSADASDFGAASPAGQVIIPAGMLSATVDIPVIDDDEEEGAESFTVTITGVSNTSGDAVVAAGGQTGTVTVPANDSDLQAPVGATIFELDFETDGEALTTGGFDGALGTNQAIVVDAATSEIEGGKLVVQTAEGDINDGTDDQNASLNDFTKTVDLSDPALTEVFLTTRFDNPFDAEFFTQQGLTGTNVPNYAQQGIVLGTGTQLAGQQVKLVWGGVAAGPTAPDATGIQMWSKGSGGVNQQATLAQMIAPGNGLLDVAAIEMSLVIDKTAGTIGQYVTLFNAIGAVIGGVRPAATAGFFTAAPVALPAAVLANILSDTDLTHVGVTSSDNTVNPATVGSFEASWDFLRLSSPQFTETGGEALVSIAAPADVVEGGDTGATDLVFALSANDGLTGDLEITLSVNGTETVETIGFVDGAATFAVSVAQDSRWNGTESVEVTIVSVGTADYAPNPSAATATGDVTEDDPADVFAGTQIGDFSDDRLAPTDVGTLQIGASAITASQQGDAAPGARDRDFITFTVAEGQVLTNLFLEGYETTEGTAQAFMALQSGSQVTVDPTTGIPDDSENPQGPFAGIVYGGGNLGNDLLPILAAGDPADAQGADFPGFTMPLAAGTYTLWLNQGGPSTTLNLRLVTEALVPTISISDAAPVLEADGAQLAFTLTADDDTLNGQTVTITYDTADAAGLTQDVTFTGTTGVLTIPVIDDDEADGDDIVTVTLTGASGGALVDATPASGTVAEDDVDAGLPKGALVLAINAGPAGAIAGDAIEGIDFGADTGFSTPSNTFTDTGGGGDTNGNAAAFDGTIYETERFAKLLTYTLTQKADGTPLVSGEQYVLELYFAELYQSAVGARKFDVTLNGAEVLADDLDVFAEVGLDDPATPEVEGIYRIQTLATVVDGAITIELNANAAVGGVDNAKINGLALFEAPVDPTAVSVSVVDVTVDEDAAEATITFTRTGAATEAVTITYSTSDGTATAGEDYTAVSTTVVIPADGDGTATVTIPLTGDAVNEGDETFTVTIDGAAAPTNNVTIADAEATVTLTDNDAPLQPIGFGPGDDLDQDGEINSLDDDIDGDGALNGAETFVYDATNAGTALVQGDAVRLEFDTEGTPFVNGFTGALVSSKASTIEIDLAAAAVANDVLTIRASGGDANTGGNTQQNALVAGFRAVEGMRVETRFAAPDWNANSDGVQTPVSFQSAGVVIGLDQDNYIKAVFGRGPQEFEFGTEIGGSTSNTATDPIATNDYAAIAEIVIVLETFIDSSGDSPVAKARAFGTLLDGGGQPLAGADAVELGGGAKTLSGPLAAAVLNGTVLGAGVTQTANNNKPVFDVSYQYLEVTALGTPPVDEAPTVDAGIADQNAVETGEFNFAVPTDAFADDGGAENLTLTAELADGSGLPAWLIFDGTTFTGTPPDGAAGDLEIRVLANDGTNPSAETSFTLSIADDAAPGAISIGDAPEVLETGDTGVTTLLFPLTMVPPTAGDVTVAYIAGPVGQEGEAGSTVVSFDAAGVGVLSIDVPNDDVDDATDISVLLTAVTGTDVALGAPLVATGTVAEDDAIDPVDIDGDGIANTADPFAYDGTNGDAKALIAGGSFTQGFDADTTDPFDAAGGFSGILVNPAFDYGNPADPAADPYGNRTSGAPGVEIAGGTLNVTSTETDAFSTGTGTNNTLADGYQSAVDVTGVNSFEVHARASSADWLSKATSTDGFEQFGVTLGAGGVDDFVKLVIGDSQGGAQRVQIAHANSLTVSGDQNYAVGASDGPDVDLALVGDIEFRLIVDKAAGTVVGQVDFLASADGALLESFTTPALPILAGGSLAAAMNGANPLTGGDGGLAYGIFVSDWGGGAGNRITANYDFLTVRALDAVPAALVSISDAPSAVEAGDGGVTTLLFDLAYTGGADETRVVTYSVNGEERSESVTFTAGAATLAVDVDNDDLADGDDAITVVLTGIGDNVADMVDPAGTSATATVTEDDFAPVAVADTPSTPQDTAITFNPAANDTDADTDAALLQVVAIDTTATTGGTVTLNGDDTVTVTPDAGSIGEITFGYTVEDPAGNRDETGTATVTVTANAIISLSGAPSAVEAGDDGDTTTLSFTVITDASVDGDVAVTYAVGDAVPVAATISFSEGVGGLEVPVAADDLANGPDSVQVALVSTSTPGFAVDATVATGTVTEDDFAPVAVADTPSTPQNTAITFDPAANDTDADLGGGALVVTAIDTAGIIGGTATLNGDGTVTVTPDAGFTGDITFGYTVSDPAGNSAPGTAAVTVEAPVVSGDPIRIEAEDFTSSVVYAPQTVGSASGDEVIFLPRNGATGSATYDLAAKGVAAGTYDVEVVYYDENDGVSVVGVSVDGASIGSITFDEDTPSNAASALNIRSQTFFGVTVGATGQLVLNGMSEAGEFARIDYIEFTPVGDVVDPENTAPFAPFDLPDASRVQNAAFDLDAGALFADSEEDALTFTATATTGDGALVDGLPAGVTFDTATGVFGGAPSAPGSYVITVTANDGALDSDPEAFTLTVQETNDAPVLVAAITDQTVQAGDPVAFGVAGAFDDPDGDPLTYSFEGDLPEGVDFDPATGLFSGTVAASAPARSYQVTVTATDTTGSNTAVSDTFLFNVTGGGVDTRPTVRLEAEDGTLVDGFFKEKGSRIRLLEEDDGTATYDLSGIAQGEYLVKVGYFDENDGESTLGVSVSSEAGTPFSAGFTLDEATTSSVASQSRNFREKTLDGTLTLGANGVLTLTGQADAGEFLRIDWIELIPVGGGGTGNFAPSEAGAGIPDATVQGLGAISLDAASAFADPEEDALTYAKVSGPDWVSVDPATGAITGTPPAGGVYGIVVSAEDAANNPGILATSDFTLTVEVPDNAAPTADAIILDAVDETAAPVSIDLLADANAADGDGDALGVEGVTVKDAAGNDVIFTLDGTSLSIDPAQFAALDSGESATVTVSYDVTDGKGGVTPNTATLTVDGVDDASVPTVSIAGTPTAPESGDDGTQTTLVFDLAYTGGANETRDVTYIVNGGDERTATVTFTDGVGALAVTVDNDDLADGTDDITVVLTGIGDNVTDMVDTAARTATGMVSEDDFAPVAVADTASTAQGAPVTFDPAANDTDADGGTLTVTGIDTGATTGGTVILNGDGSVTVTPDAGFSGQIAFGYTVADSAGNLDAAGSAAVTVTGGVDTRPTVRIEAETGTLSGGFSVEKGERIRTSSDGEATYDLSGVAGGDYLVRLGYWDENDGASSVGVTMSSASAGTFSDTLPLAEETPSGTFSSKNFRETTLDGVFKLGANGLLTLTGLAQGSEIVRIDWIELIPTGAPAGNAAPSVSLTNALAGIPDDADTGAPIKVADIVVTDDGQGENALGLTGADADLFEIVGTELFLKAGAALDATANPSLDVTVTVDDASVGASPDGAAPLSLPVTDAPVTGDDLAPDGDLDGDGTANSADGDVDGDGVPNADDPFAYDAANGMTLAAGETRIFDFDVDGTIFQNGLTGFLQGTANGGAFDEDTGANSVSGGLLTVDPVTGGDTGNSNNPQDDAVVGVKNGTFTAKAVVLNPWVGAAPNPGGFDQLGLVLGLDSADMIKLVFGQTAGVVEFQKQEGDVGTKYGAGTGNVPLPAGVTLDSFARAEITFDVVSIDATSATVTGAIAFQNVDGSVITTLNLPAAPIGGALAAALADPAIGVAVGFTHVDATAAPTFVAQLDSLSITAAGAPAEDLDPPTAAITLTNPADADAPLLVSVALDDASGIDAGTLGAEDLALSVSGVPAILPITFDGFADGVASYSIAAPAGGWTQGLPVAVTLKAGEVADLAATPNTNAAASQSLTLDIGGGTGGGEDEVVFRINAGGNFVAATDGGPDWVADSIASPNVYLAVTDNRADTGGLAVSNFDGVPSAVFAEARSSNGAFSYDIPTSVLENGENYEVRLYFAEIFAGAQGGDFRNFDATVEGFVPAAFNNIDPGALFGANAGILTTQVKVTDGTLNIGFTQDVKQNPIISAIEVVKLSTDVENPEPPVNPGNALEAFAAQDDIVKDATYGAGATGSAVLEIMKGDNNIQSSNFGANSFEVTNTGDKKISAIFIDVSSALYQDSVFDPDGQGGDNAAKSWQINSAGNTGAFITGNGYFLPGVDPIPNSGGSGGDSNGGFKGAMVKFNANSSGGFELGETVGFSGDMDPNSIAGMTKASVDGSAILSWDVGGISGHELIGSLFTVLFDDGTTASGQLASDGSSAGSHALATQGAAPATAPGIAVNGVLPGQNGTYGGTLPAVTVTGNPGDKVQITMTKGFNPVTETSNGIADLVEDRLERYDFKANNAFDAQTKIVTIGADGTFDASTLFDYDDAINNNVGSGSFAGDDVAQIGFVATKVQSGGTQLPIGPTTAPIYLTNVGGPVPGDPTGGTGGGADGYFEIVGSGSAAYFKMEIEDASVANGGTDPGGKWTFVEAPDGEGRQSGFTGDGYYLYGSNTSTGINNVVGSEVLEYTILVPEGQTGNYNFQFRVSRDGTAASDQQNDLWLNFKEAGKAGAGDIEEYLTNTTNEPEPLSNGYIKIFGGPNDGTWGTASAYDGLPGNPSAQINIPEAGLYTIQVAGRSQGFHVDSFWLAKTGGSTPNAGSANSAFVPTGPAAPEITGSATGATVGDGATLAFDVDATDANGDTLTYGITGGADADLFEIDGGTGAVSFKAPADFSEPADAGGNNVYDLQVTVSDPGGLSDVRDYAVTVTDTPPEPVTLRKAIVAGSDDTDQNAGGGTVNLTKGDMELGDGGRDVGLRFTDLDLESLEGVDILDAYIQFTARSGSSGAVNATVKLQDTVSAATFSAASGPTDRDTFDFVADWTDSSVPAAGSTFRTDDLSDLIEAFVAAKSADLGTEDDLAFVIEDVSGVRKALSFEGGAAAELVIVYDDILGG